MEELARQAVTRWGIREPRLRLIKYRENAVFELVAGDGARYALRIHRSGYHSEAALLSELQWMAALDASGIAVPVILPDATGASFAVVASQGVPEPRQVDIFHWVEGRQFGSVEEGIADPAAIERLYRVLGALAARLHNQAVDWTLPRGFTRHAWDAEGLVGEQPFWGQFWALAALTAAERELLQAARERVHADLVRYSLNPGNRDRYSMIHADLVAENLLVDGETVRLIDFDDAGFGWHLFELATALYFEMEQDYYPVAYSALITGYREHRSLPDDQIEQLPLFLLARSFTYLGWVHTRKETETARELTPMLVHKACNLARQYLGG
jgi:Ser/Thr protein kinase RdoA (MazF antagonist)